MENMIETCCGIDVHQKNIVCCLLDGPLSSNRPKKQVRSFGTTSSELREALAWLEENNVTHVFMESTGQYWRPVYNIFNDGSFKQILANPQRIKNVPGRKTDTKDAEWIAKLGRSGLVEASYIPSEEVLELRQLTRDRQAIIDDRSKIKNRVHNILQRSNIKLTSYLTDVFGVTGQTLLSIFINGEVITLETIKASMRKGIKALPSELLAAMDGRLSNTDRKLLGSHLRMYNALTKEIDYLTQEINQYLEKHFKEEYELLLTIPGIKEQTAAIILGEIGPDLSNFPTVGHLASWAGVSPGSNESAGLSKSSRTTKGNKYVRRALFLAGGTAGRSQDLAYSSLYLRVTSRGSKMKAIVACAHKHIRIIYKILTERVPYNEKKALGLRQQSLTQS